MKYFSQTISVLFHPIFITLYAFALYYCIEHFSTMTLRSLPTDRLLWIFSLIVVFTIIFPGVSVFLMKRSKIISDYTIEDRRERIPILLVSLLYLCVFYYLIRSIDLQQEVILFGFFLSVMTGAILLSLFSVVITYFWKISLHAIAISGLAGAMIALLHTLAPVANVEKMVLINSIVLLVAGLVCFARLHQNAHSYLQVIAGMVLGFSVEFLVIRNIIIV